MGKDKCAFCGRKENEVSKLFSGINHVLICDNCIETCHSMLEQEDILMAEKSFHEEFNILEPKKNKRKIR